MFFCRSYGAHHGLPSFPTRRSSDLLAVVLKTGGTAERDDRRRCVVIRDGDSATGVAREAVTSAVVIRSEEHTSELQSRRDLVCRLLLEKKKEQTSTEATTPRSPPND